jgi:hypothetical protein
VAHQQLTNKKTRTDAALKTLETLVKSNAI